MKKVTSFLLAAFLFISTFVSIVPSASAGSWQAYVDTELVGTGKLSQAAIIGTDGAMWAHSKGFEPSASETKALAELFNNPANVFATGVALNGIRYMGIKGDESSIYGKKGATGIATAKTGQTILIGVYDDKGQPGNAASTVEQLAAYLRSNGY